MMDLNGKLLYISTILVISLSLGSGAQDAPVDQPLKGLEKTQNITNLLVYMADTTITVREFDTNIVPITVFRSEALAEGTYVDLALSYDDKRDAYLHHETVHIRAHDTNATTYLDIYDASHLFFPRDSIYDVTITECHNCDIGIPKSTTITFKPETNVTLSFEYAYDSGQECYCDGCCYDYIGIRSSKRLTEFMVITLLTDSKDTAEYNKDYSLDRQFLDPQPTLNLTTYDTYHYGDVYIRRDGRLEDTEYFHLRFDEKSLPDRVFVGSIKETRFEIYDSDYGFISITNGSQHVSEDVGTIDVIVETNIIQDNKSLALFVTMEPTYGSDSESATPEKDFVPFARIYFLPPGASSTVIPITIINDDLAESEERFAFKVEAYYLREYFDDYATIYIDDDETSETPLLFSFDKTSFTVTESSGTLEFYVRANIKNEAYVFLQYIPAEENGLLEYYDYTAYFNFTIKQDIFQFDKDTEHKIEVNILNDCDVEMTELMVLNISDVSIGQADPENYNLTIIVEDNDQEGALDCLACSCGGGIWPTEQPSTEPESIMFNFELDEFEIYEGECSFYDIDVVATKPTTATVFIGIQPWELEYGEDFTISAKKLVFENNDRQNFSFRALQDTIDEDVESALINIAYASDGMIGRRNVILVHVMNEKGTTSEDNSRSARSIKEPSLQETRSEAIGSTAITTGLVAGLVSSLLVVMVTTILFGLAVVIRKPKP